MRSLQNFRGFADSHHETYTRIIEDVIHVWTDRVLLISIIALLLPVEVDQLEARQMVKARSKARAKKMHETMLSLQRTSILPCPYDTSVALTLYTHLY
jgi:hypothetical protein